MLCAGRQHAGLYSPGKGPGRLRRRRLQFHAGRSRELSDRRAAGGLVSGNLQQRFAVLRREQRREFSGRDGRGARLARPPGEAAAQASAAGDYRAEAGAKVGWASPTAELPSMVGTAHPTSVAP